MANKTSSKDLAGGNGAAGQVDVVMPRSASSTRVEVLNLAAMRAARSRQRPVIVDQYDKEHDLSGLSLDAYLALLEIEGDFGNLARDEQDGKMGRDRQIALIKRMRDTITAVLPDFPAGGLYLDELYAVGQAIQRAVMPGRIQEIEGDAEPGKST